MLVWISCEALYIFTVCDNIFIGGYFHSPGQQTMLRAALDEVHLSQTDAHGESGQGAGEWSSEWQRRVCSCWRVIVGGGRWVVLIGQMKRAESRACHARSQQQREQQQFAWRHTHTEKRIQNDIKPEQSTMSNFYSIPFSIPLPFCLALLLCLLLLLTLPLNLNQIKSRTLNLIMNSIKNLALETENLTWLIEGRNEFVELKINNGI